MLNLLHRQAYLNTESLAGLLFGEFVELWGHGAQVAEPVDGVGLEDSTLAPLSLASVLSFLSP